MIFHKFVNTRQLLRLFLVSATILLAGVDVSLAQSGSLGAKVGLAEASAIQAQLDNYGSVRVIVEFDVGIPSDLLMGGDPSLAGQSATDPSNVKPAKPLSAAASTALSGHEGTVRARQDAVIANLTALDTSSSALPASPAALAERWAMRRMKYFPMMALSVHAAELDALTADASIRRIHLDALSRPSLTQSVPLIGMNAAYAGGATGNGMIVAITDTGVEYNHVFFGGTAKVTNAICRSSNVPSQGATTVCPGGGTVENGGNSGLNCSATVSGCNHGTHVAGIAAGNHTTGGSPANGVAKDAKIYAAQVFSRIDNGSICGGFGLPSPCALTYTSDLIAALEFILADMPNLATTLAAVNMSLGGGTYTTFCDTNTLKPVIDALRAANVATAIASGNSGFTNAVGAPGCISTAITVGSTDKLDVISSFSNMASMVDVMAPGSSIQSSVPGGFSFFNGTSMATPHVAGAFAAIRSALPAATVSQIEVALENTGLPITDGRVGGTVTKPRIRVDQACRSLGGCGGIRSDFNGDGTSDLLIRNTSSGYITYGEMNNGALVSWHGVTALGLGWTVQDVGDFNADSTSDLLIRNTSSGYITYGEMSGGALVAWHGVTALGLDWIIQGVGDFNGDGTDDLLIRNTSSGYITYGEMNNGALVAWHGVTALGLGWTVQQVGDFNGDGTSDLLIRNTSSGYITYGEMNNGSLVSWHGVTALGLGWAVQDVGNFNADGTSDLLIRNTTSGYITYGEMSGGALVSWHGVTALGLTWAVKGGGDFNGESTDDLLIRNTTSGFITYGEMSNGALVSWHGVTSLGTDWLLIP